jgi:hypothetical protein
MNTVSTDLPTEVSEQLQTLFAAAQTTLRQREEDAFVTDMKAEEERITKLQAEWAEPLKALTSRLPEWIHKYIQAPTHEHNQWASDISTHEYGFVRIEVPGCNDIAAFVDDDGLVGLEALRPSLEQNDDDGLWLVRSNPTLYRRTRWQIDQMEYDIAITLFNAHEMFLRRLELEEAAEQRNAAFANPPAPAPVIPDPIDQARRLVAMMTDDEPIKRVRSDDDCDFADDRTLVLASVGIAIAYHISRVADALESKGI